VQGRLAMARGVTIKVNKSETISSQITGKNQFHNKSFIHPYYL